MTAIQEPQKYTPVHNPIDIVLDSPDKSSNAFKYILDVLVNGTIIATLKAQPDPENGYGYFDLSRILTDFVKATFNPVNNNVFSPAPIIQVGVSAGQEYVQNNGSVLLSRGQLQLNSFHVFNGSLEWASFVNYDSSVYADGSYLTNESKTQTVPMDTPLWVDFLNDDVVDEALLTTYLPNGSVRGVYSIANPYEEAANSPYNRNLRLGYGTQQIGALRTNIDATLISGGVDEIAATNFIRQSQDFASALWINKDVTSTANTTMSPFGTLTADTITATGASPTAYEKQYVENSAQNLILQSETIDNVYWSKVNSSITANAAMSPFGAMTADRLVPNATFAQHRLDRATTSTNAIHTWSIFAKADGYNFATLRMDISGGGRGASFNLSAGTVGTTDAGITARIVDFGGGWYRISITALALANTAIRCNVEPSGSIATDWSGNGTSGVLFFGAQFELGSIATSYIPTVAATVTRAATITAEGAYEFSIYAKAGTHDVITLEAAGYLGSTSTTTRYNLTTGTSTNLANPIESVGDGWYRLSFNITLVSTGLSGAIRVYISPDIYFTSWVSGAAATGKSVILFGAQFEQGTVATSYIPTTTTPVTRPVSYIQALGDGVSKYTLSLRAAEEVVKELVTVNIDQNCDRFSDNACDLWFLNNFGGWGHVRMSKKNTKFTDSSRVSVKQTPGSYNITGVTYKTYDAESRNAYTQYKNRMILNSAFLSDSQFKAYEELSTSPIIYMRDENGVFYNVNVLSNTYEHKKVLNNRLSNLQLEVEYSISNNRQRL
jgi:hypothetical protein